MLCDPGWWRFETDGEDKAELILDGEPVVARIMNTLQSISSTVVLNRNRPLTKGEISIPVIKDRLHDVGPLGGLHAVIHEREEEWFVLSACDTPFVSPALYQYLLKQCHAGVSAVIPIYKGRMHPLSGVYHRSLSTVLDDYLRKGGRKISGFLEAVPAVFVKSFPTIEESQLASHFFNMNTKADYEEALRIVEN
ncbi:molybdenum cofactor guanylyltransferase [Halobacillus salinarum]|uniref:Molybdenum cofactor guanylyltransferase n=1 Tax=Halobacillus salinarum TaxID=2932257 RepID=A0ABY4EE80_9BACI|nr:molybdenum cofactor guanylyltransferase [Halobacillus salinarum]UOQ42774.1 molybdenum cofactor guanylyltransferase [Halobacillus salinarum]